MSPSKKSLEDALAQNGTPDPERGRSVQQSAVARFDAGMRRVGRITFLYLCVCTWLLVFSYFHFLQVSDTKHLLLYSVMMIVFLEGTVLIKLWYWVMNTKIDVLKEIKQLRLEMPHDDALPEPDAENRRGSLRPLRWAERTFWWVLFVAGIVAVAWVKSHDVPPDGDFPVAGTLTSVASVTLAPDGSASAVTDVSCQHEGPLAKSRFQFHAPRSSTVRWTDATGRELTATPAPADDHTRYYVGLAERVYPGMRFSYARTEESPAAAEQDGDSWTYRYDLSYGYGTNELAATVALPQGAEVVAAEPWPDARFRLGDRSMLRFQAKRGADEPFRFTVRYRLPPETPDAERP